MTPLAHDTEETHVLSDSSRSGLRCAVNDSSIMCWSRDMNKDRGREAGIVDR